MWASGLHTGSKQGINSDQGPFAMERASYLRNQALMCLEIAWQASDPDTAEALRVAGLRYFEQAVELEKQRCFADIQASIGEELRTELAPTKTALPKRMLDLLNELNTVTDH
jgi:hypothetical protein